MKKSDTGSLKTDYDRDGGPQKLFAKHAVSSLDAYNQIADLPLKAIVIAIDHFDVIKEMGIEEEEFFTKLTRMELGLVFLLLSQLQGLILFVRQP